MGFEPTTRGLEDHCSPTELRPHETLWWPASPCLANDLFRSAKASCGPIHSSGADDGSRTRDLRVGNAALYL